MLIRPTSKQFNFIQVFKNQVINKRSMATLRNSVIIDNKTQGIRLTVLVGITITKRFGSKTPKGPIPPLNGKIGNILQKVTSNSAQTTNKPVAPTSNKPTNTAQSTSTEPGLTMPQLAPIINYGPSESIENKANKLHVREPLPTPLLDQLKKEGFNLASESLTVPSSPTPASSSTHNSAPNTTISITVSDNLSLTSKTGALVVYDPTLLIKPPIFIDSSGKVYSDLAGKALPPIIEKQTTSLDNNNSTINTATSSSLRFTDMPVVPSNILTQDSPAVIQAKYAIQHFVQGLQPFRNDTELFNYWTTQIKEHPGVMTRAFQVAVEITYNKRKFSGNELTKILEGKIDILAVGDSDIAKIDSSTLYTILQTKHISNQHNIENAVVVLPPADTANLTTKVLSPTDQVFVQGSQQATGNTVCDMKFLNHYYDYKAMGNFKFTKNHILFIDFHEQESIKPYQFLKQLLSTLKAKQQMQREDKITMEYYEKATKKLEYVLNNKGSNLEKLDEWNAYVFSTLERRPNTIFFPLMIPTNRDSITKEMLNDSVVNMTFPLKKALETFDIKKILDDIYSRMTPKQLRDATYITRGAYEDSDTFIETN